MYEYGAIAVTLLHPGKDQRMIFGYLDAGSGSLILQAILGGAAGLLVAFKAWKARLMGKRAMNEAQTDTTTTES
jgi:hypothetical protein